MLQRKARSVTRGPEFDQILFKFGQFSRGKSKCGIDCGLDEMFQEKDKGVLVYDLHVARAEEETVPDSPFADITDGGRCGTRGAHDVHEGGEGQMGQ